MLQLLKYWSFMAWIKYNVNIHVFLLRLYFMKLIFHYKNYTENNNTEKEYYNCRIHVCFVCVYVEGGGNFKIKLNLLELCPG